MTANELKRQLDIRGLRPVELAEIMGRSQPGISLMLSGARSIPAAEVRAALEAWDASDEAKLNHDVRGALRHLRMAKNILDEADHSVAYVVAKAIRALMD